MLRRSMGDQRFLAILGDIAKPRLNSFHPKGKTQPWKTFSTSGSMALVSPRSSLRTRSRAARSHRLKIQLAHGQSVTRWIASSSDPVTFTATRRFLRLDR
jgi:hypothetical protein